MGWQDHNFAESQAEAKAREHEVVRAKEALHRKKAVRESYAEAISRELAKIRSTEARTTAQQIKRQEREAKAIYKEERIAEADAETAEYEAIYAEIDSILEATLNVDDYTDPESLKKVTSHPKFEAGPYGTPTPEPNWVVAPPEPAFAEPPKPSMLGRMFGGGKKHAEEVEAASAQWQQEHANWQAYVNQELPKLNEQLQRTYAGKEEVRIGKLRVLEMEYEESCEKREEDTLSYNRDVDIFIEELHACTEGAVEEYFRVVFANSVYPEYFSIDRACSYSREEKELELKVTVPEPSELPTVKHVKYVASKDEFKTTELSVTAQKTRFNQAVFATALRTIHEVFEADRHEIVESVSLTVKMHTPDPATGHPSVVPLVLAACDRTQFMDLFLENVEPLAALKGLRAILSKSPFGAMPAISDGIEVRR